MWLHVLYAWIYIALGVNALIEKLPRHRAQVPPFVAGVTSVSIGGMALFSYATGRILFSPLAWKVLFALLVVLTLWEKRNVYNDSLRDADPNVALHHQRRAALILAGGVLLFEMPCLYMAAALASGDPVRAGS